MLRLISIIFMKLIGWTVDDSIAKVPGKAVVIASPHTSNWDFPIARAAFSILRIPVKYTLKSEFMRFPLNLLFGPLGAIGIDRSPKKPGEKRRSMTAAMVDEFNKRDKLSIMVTPEGTRSLRTKWKTGFYYIAVEAKVPIALGYLDFSKKIAGVGKVFYPTGDIEKDMKEITAFYKPIIGKFPEKFSIDLRYDEVENGELKMEHGE